MELREAVFPHLGRLDAEQSATQSLVRQTAALQNQEAQGGVILQLRTEFSALSAQMSNLTSVVANLSKQLRSHSPPVCPDGPFTDIFEPSMVHWQTSDTYAGATTHRVSGHVLSFMPCAGGSDCAGHVDDPVVTADIRLPCQIITISGSFEQRNTGSNPIDDCYSSTAPHTEWFAKIHGNDGYVMFGTPSHIIYGGCGHGGGSGTTTNSFPATEIRSNTIRFAGSQDSPDETFDIDLSGLQIGHRV